MVLFISPDSSDGVPTWWTGELRAGHLVDLEVYGDRMTGRLVDGATDTIRIRIPAGQQASGLRLSTAHGTAEISLAGGAARVPVSCWATGDLIRLLIIGAVEFIQRRVHPRLAVQLPVTLGWLRQGKRTWDHARSDTVDISLGGIRIAPATTVWPGSGVHVQVMLALPDGDCQLQAVVVGTTPDYGLRLEFSELPASTAARIERLTFTAGSGFRPTPDLSKVETSA
jgi:c-di-GMP-binding flagellar brake protein YcgR